MPGSYASSSARRREPEWVKVERDIAVRSIANSNTAVGDRVWATLPCHMAAEWRNGLQSTGAPCSQGSHSNAEEKRRQPSWAAIPFQTAAIVSAAIESFLKSAADAGRGQASVGSGSNDLGRVGSARVVAMRARQIVASRATSPWKLFPTAARTALASPPRAHSRTLRPGLSAADGGLDGRASAQVASDGIGDTAPAPAISRSGTALWSRAIMGNSHWCARRGTLEPH
jgi:hypothetical protein